MRVYVLINSRAGGTVSSEKGALSRYVVNAFEQAGHVVLAETAEPSEIESKLDGAVVFKPDVLLIGGGDGTIRSGARKALETGASLGVLPLGTINRLARDLGIPLSFEEAVQTLARGELKKIDVAEVNGHIFLCNSLIGLPPQISDERQKLRGSSLPARIVGYFALLTKIISARHRIELTIDNETIRGNMRVLSMAISNNPYSEQRSLLLTRATLDSGTLGIYISKHRSGLGLLGVLIRTTLGWWDGDSDLERVAAKQISVDSKQKRLRVLNDGEVERLQIPICYSIRPKALTVLVPAIITT